MSSPYVYTPRVYPQTNPYVDAYFARTEPSPFIPDATLYPASPYVSATNTPRRVRFSDLPDEYHRVRRPSWHGGEPPVLPSSVPFPSSPYHHSPYLVQPDLPYHQRRHSFGTTSQPPWYQSFNSASYTWPYSTVNQFLVHPYLNAESPRPDFFFDLSDSRFSPLLWSGPSSHTTILPQEYLSQPATHPGITRMRIICDRIPNWPIDLEYNPYYQSGATAAVPITVGDVLVALHRHLHARITHIEWAQLSHSEETKVARAYTKRCRAIPSTAEYEMSQGVQRVDFLLDQVIFRGLLRTSTQVDGFDVFKLVLGAYT